MHDLGYVVAGYLLTTLGVVGYRWRLAVRARRATSTVQAATGRKAVGRRR